MQLLMTTTGTQNPVIFPDLGDRQFSHPTNSYDLTDEFSIIELMDSVDLQAALTAGHITLVSDNGLNVIGLIKDFEFWNSDEIRGKFVDNGNIGDGYYLKYYASSGNVEYINPQNDPLFSKRVIYSLSFFTSSTPYVEYSSTTWQAVNQFAFLGSDVVVPQLVVSVVSRNTPDVTNTAELRIYDTTNLNQIAIITWASDVLQIIETSTLTNVPTTQAIFEVQVRKIGPSAPKVRLHSLVMY